MKGELIVGMKEAGPGDEGFLHFMAAQVGTAKQGGEEFVLMKGMGGTPIIEHVKTGRSWSPSWQELLNAAIAGGLLKPKAEVTFKKHDKKPEEPKAEKKAKKK